jgi:hypothetical protein
MNQAQERFAPRSKKQYNPGTQNRSFKSALLLLLDKNGFKNLSAEMSPPKSEEISATIDAETEQKLRDAASFPTFAAGNMIACEAAIRNASEMSLSPVAEDLLLHEANRTSTLRMAKLRLSSENAKLLRAAITLIFPNVADNQPVSFTRAVGLLITSGVGSYQPAGN